MLKFPLVSSILWFCASLGAQSQTLKIDLSTVLTEKIATIDLLESLGKKSLELKIKNPGDEVILDFGRDFLLTGVSYQFTIANPSPGATGRVDFVRRLYSPDKSKIGAYLGTYDFGEPSIFRNPWSFSHGLKDHKPDMFAFGALVVTDKIGFRLAEIKPGASATLSITSLRVDAAKIPEPTATLSVLERPLTLNAGESLWFLVQDPTVPFDLASYFETDTSDLAGVKLHSSYVEHIEVITSGSNNVPVTNRLLVRSGSNTLAASEPQAEPMGVVTYPLRNYLLPVNITNVGNQPLELQNVKLKTLPQAKLATVFLSERADLKSTQWHEFARRAGWEFEKVLPNIQREIRILK